MDKNMDKNQLAKLQSIVESGQSFALFGHRNIDGDAMGSILGFGGVLEKLGKDVSYFTSNIPSVVFDFVHGREKIQTEFDFGSYDALIFMDFSPYDRIEEFTRDNTAWFDEQTLVVIDHHKGDVPSHAAVVLKDTDTISNASRSYEIVKELWPDMLDKHIATSLYMGLTTDSGNFLYDQQHQSQRVFRNAYELVSLGADKQCIVDNLLRTKSFEAVEFMQVLLSRMKQYKGNILSSYMSSQELEERGLDRYQGGFALPIMQSISGVDLIMLFKEDYDKGTLSCSFRGKGVYDCSVLAAHFGGGGHANAAGCKVMVGDRNFEEKKLAMIDYVYTKLSLINPH